MRKDITLVVLAAGIGSRFGGLKQMEPVGPNGEFIIDYSVYDAIKAGFNKIVFVIKKEMYNDFKETIGKRIENKINVQYAFQDITDIPSDVTIIKDRIKPLGTGHALYCARSKVNEPFGVISADDFYGRDAFEILANSLINKKEYSVICYKIFNTLTKNGSVKRGVCFTNDNKLEAITESKVDLIDNVIIGIPLDGGAEFTLDKEHPVSMLIYGLQPDIFNYINNDMSKFFCTDDALLTGEYLLPSILDKMLKEGNNINYYKTDAVWQGITYISDLEKLKNHINTLITQKEYPYNLWD